MVRYRWLLIRGEINALSAWQVAVRAVDVLSLGSESAKLSPAAVAAAQSYGRVLCWADRSAVAQSLMAALPGAYGVRSPGGKDANDLCRVATWVAFWRQCAQMRPPAWRAGERLLWALWDAAGLPVGIDAGSAAVLKPAGWAGGAGGSQAVAVQAESG